MTQLAGIASSHTPLSAVTVAAAYAFVILRAFAKMSWLHMFSA